MKCTILGSGTSHGVPMIACDCPVCTSKDPRDTRSRASALFQFDGCSILIDTAPELRLQCLACDVRRIDAVLYTHHHADHVVGLDDLRRFNAIQRRPIPLYASPETGAHLRRTFDYAFNHDPEYPSAKPDLTLIAIDGPFELLGRTVLPVPLLHGSLPILGFRIGSIAYCTDCSRIPDESLALLADLDFLILDGLRHRPHATHFNLAQAIVAAQRVNARQTYFTHIAHELLHADVDADLPPSMHLAWDGLVLEATD